MKQLDNKNPADQSEIARLFGQAPEWVNYISFDHDGHQCWFEKHPQKPQRVWLKTEGRCKYFPFDGLHFENTTYANCLIERPRTEHDVFGQPTRFWQRFKDWRLTRQNKAAKEAASEVERLINCGK